LDKKYSAFFDDIGVKKPFADVLTEVQEHISSKFSTLLSDNPEEQKKQICAYIAKYLTDYNISVFAVMLNNVLMVPVMAVGFAMLPFWYVMFTANFYKKQLNAELETALSIITTSYLRNENFITAVEENVSYLNPPVCDVFRQFLAQTNLINADLRLALDSIKYKIASDVYREWLDAVIACQDDKTLKTTLTPIISKLSDMRVVSAELDMLLYEPMKEFMTMALLLVGNIPLIYFLNRDWFGTLMNTIVGKGVLAISAAALFVSLAAVIRLTRLIEYKR